MDTYVHVQTFTHTCEHAHARARTHNYVKKQILINLRFTISCDFLLFSNEY